MNETPREQKKIIAYRVGPSLWCPACHDETAKGLRASQDPNDPELKLPSKPITAGIINIFICERCERVIGDPKISTEKQRELEALREERYLQMRLGVTDQFEKQNLGKKALKQLDELMKFNKFKIEMAEELAKISQRVKLTRRTVHAACDGHPLSLRSILTLRKLLDDLAEKIDPARSMIICDLLDDIL